MEIFWCSKIFLFHGASFWFKLSMLLFHEVIAAPAYEMRAMSHNCFVYLDDSISGNRDYVSACVASVIQRKDLTAAGFVANEEKSQWGPTQIGELLGFLINTIRLTFQIPERKIEKLRNSLVWST